MTAYGDRRRAGEYDVGAVTTTRQDTIHDPQTGGTTVQPSPPPVAEPEPEELTLKELQEQAEQLGLPTYGTKAQIAQRIAEAQ